MTELDRQRSGALGLLLVSLGSTSVACLDIGSEDEPPAGSGGAAGASLDGGGGWPSEAGGGSAGGGAAGDAGPSGPCTELYDLCKDQNGKVLPPGDHLLVDPPNPKLGETLRIYLVSTLAVSNATLQINKSWCAGAATQSSCVTGAGCVGWAGFQQSLYVESPPFTAGQMASLTFFINGPPDTPCDATSERQVTTQVQVGSD